MNTLKKLILGCLMALMILLPMASYAQQEYLTIGELREQVEGGWQQTYQTKWRTVEIDAEVKLPQTDTIPILKVMYDTPETTVTAEESGWLEVKPQLDALFLYNGTKKAPKTLDGKRLNTYAETREMWRSDFAPENQYIPMSDITYGEICDMLRDQLLLFGYDPTQFQLEEPVLLWARHWFLYGYKKDVLPGQLSLETRQTLYDLPILGHISLGVHNGYTMLAREDEICPFFGLSAGYDAYGEQLSDLSIRAAKPVDILAADVPLCPLDKVIAAIEPEIESGHIRKIYEVELGYIIYNEPGVYYSQKEALVEGRNTQEELEAASASRLSERISASYYLRPMWQVNCLWVKSPSGKLRETSSYTTDERNSLDYYQLLVDAQTGELVQESTAYDRCEFKGFISWDDVGSNR